MIYKFLTIIIMLLVQLLFWHGSIYAKERKTGAGVLTEKSSYNVVVINGTKYSVDALAELLDDRGRTLTVDTLPLHARFYIEYEESEEAGQRVIKLMKLLPE